MYTVQWCNEEGVLCERRFESLCNAYIEAEDLREKYDGVQIVDANGNVLHQ